MRGLALDMIDGGRFLPVVGPFDSPSAPCDADEMIDWQPYFQHWLADILGRIGRADDQDVLVLELARVAEIMGMQDAAR